MDNAAGIRRDGFYLERLFSLGARPALERGARQRGDGRAAGVRAGRSKTEVDGAKASVIRLALGSWWAFLLPHIDVVYSNDDRTLLRFVGLTNVRDTAQVDALVADWMAQRTVAEAEAALLAEGLPIAPVRTYAEAARDPHVADREMLQATSVEGNARIPIVGPAAKFSRTPVRVRSGAPALGAHSDEILAELGVEASERAELKRSGVI